ncbi:MAG: hypothetical protein HQL76_04285 [Magnetococcales bacterium]|nr:hypothetical protein [Magnetococcales bacterium]
MGRIVEIKLDENSTFFAEVADDEVVLLDDPSGQGESGPVFRGEKTLSNKVSTTVMEALETVQPVVQRVVDRFRASDPSECRVSFGLKLHGKVGVAFISEGGAEAQLKVTLRWRKPRTKKAKTKSSVNSGGV